MGKDKNSEAGVDPLELDMTFEQIQSLKLADKLRLILSLVAREDLPEERLDRALAALKGVSA